MTRKTYKRQHLIESLLTYSSDESMNNMMGIMAADKKTRHWKRIWELTSDLQAGVRKRERDCKWLSYGNFKALPAPYIHTQAVNHHFQHEPTNSLIWVVFVILVQNTHYYLYYRVYSWIEAFWSWILIISVKMYSLKSLNYVFLVEATIIDRVTKSQTDSNNFHQEFSIPDLLKTFTGIFIPSLDITKYLSIATYSLINEPR